MKLEAVIVDTKERTGADIVAEAESWIHEAQAMNIGGRGTYLDRYVYAMRDLLKLVRKLSE